MRAMLVISSLAGGGAQRVMSLLANRWARQGWKVTLITIATREEDRFVLDPSVDRVALGLERYSAGTLDAVANNRVRVIALRREIRERKPQVVVSFQDQMNVVTLIAARGTGVPVVVSERTDPQRHQIGRVWSMLRGWTYPWASNVVAQTESVARWLEGIVAADKIAVIPNPIGVLCGAGSADIGTLAAPAGSAPAVVSVGRFAPEKGFDMLVSAFAAATRERTHWHLVIFGDGPDRAALAQLADTLGVSRRVHLPGYVQEPWRYIRQADLFAMSSRFEGFPNALLEAMACGAAVVSFDCPSGPRDIIRDGVDGRLVAPGDTVALADVIAQLMDDDTERQRLGQAARTVNERYDLERIAGDWEALLFTAIREASVA